MGDEAEARRRAALDALIADGQEMDRPPFEAWWAGSGGTIDVWAISRAAWDAATERAAKVVEAGVICQCEARQKGGSTAFCECYGYGTIKRAAARIRGTA